jgi:hypothetical protein
MITEEQISSYFEALCVDSTDINHNPETNKTYFFVEEPDNLDSFDQALRNSDAPLAFLLVAEDGEFDDNGTENYTQEINIQAFVLARKTSDVDSKQAKTICLPIVHSFLAKMRMDARKGVMLSEKRLAFRIDKIAFQSVGPINTEWYGYTFWCTFYCPLSFKPKSGSWRSIPE